MWLCWLSRTTNISEGNKNAQLQSEDASKCREGHVKEEDGRSEGLVEENAGYSAYMDYLRGRYRDIEKEIYDNEKKD